MALLTSSVTSLFFFQAECLHHFQQPKISLRRRGFAHDNPPRHWGGPQTVTLWGVLRMRVMRLLFDPDRTRGCYTQARKRVASHYLCSLDCTSFFTAWGLTTDTLPFNFTWTFLTRSLQSAYQDEKLSQASLSQYCMSFIVSVGIWMHQFLWSFWELLILFEIYRVMSDTPQSSKCFISIPLYQIYCWCNIFDRWDWPLFVNMEEEIRS